MTDTTPTPRPTINEWPYPWIGNHPEWLETSVDTYDNQLGCVPPERHKEGAFAVGECYRHDKHGDPLHAMFIKYMGRYFCRLGKLHDFDPASYKKEILDQFPR